MSRQYGYEIHRTDNQEGLGLDGRRPVRYLVVCQACGLRIPRMKQSPPCGSSGALPLQMRRKPVCHYTRLL